MVSLLLDVYKCRDVATMDVLGAYLLTDMDDYVLVKLSGEVKNIMCEVNNRYIPFVVMKHEKAI